VRRPAVIDAFVRALAAVDEVDAALV